MQLTQQETNKIKERDEQHTQELREWRSEIAKKKQVLGMMIKLLKVYLIHCSMVFDVIRTCSSRVV